MENTDASKSGLPYKKVLTIRYIIALALIAGVLSFTYFFLKYQIQSNREDAHIINISGKQRMLSQRIALFSREVYHADNKAEADLFAGKMKKAIKTMTDSHLELTQNNFTAQPDNLPSDEIIKIYQGPNGINQRIETYLNTADNFIELYESGGIDAIRQSTLMTEIVSIARNGLLNELDRAVGQYQAEYEAKIDDFARYETLIYIIGLLVLLGEILFIFRPMVREMVSKTDALETTNRELLEFSYRISHDLHAPVVSSMGLSQTALASLEKDDKETTRK